MMVVPNSGQGWYLLLRLSSSLWLSQKFEKVGENCRWSDVLKPRNLLSAAILGQVGQLIIVVLRQCFKRETMYSNRKVAWNLVEE